MKKTLLVLTYIIVFLCGLVGGYAYGYGAYNRPIKPWEFWLQPKYK